MIREYLDGRVLPEVTRSHAVRAVQGRLIEGSLPVLDDSLKSKIDEMATQEHAEAKIVSSRR